MKAAFALLIGFLLIGYVIMSAIKYENSVVVSEYGGQGLRTIIAGWCEHVLYADYSIDDYQRCLNETVLQVCAVDGNWIVDNKNCLFVRKEK